MADVAGSPTSVKVEETSQSVILTYFQGDIGSMVDAHFSRALSRADRAKPQLAKPKKNRKSLKSGMSRPDEVTKSRRGGGEGKEAFYP